MKALHQRVNIVPILAKADTLTPPEVEHKKHKVREAGGGRGAGGLLENGVPRAVGPSCVSQIREEIEHFGIKVYQFPDCDSDEDEDFKLQDQALKVGPPWGTPFPTCFFRAEEGSRILCKGRLLGWERTPVPQSEAKKTKIQQKGTGENGAVDRHPYLLPGKHPICCNWQQYCSGGPRAASSRPALPLGHRGR